MKQRFYCLSGYKHCYCFFVTRYFCNRSGCEGRKFTATISGLTSSIPTKWPKKWPIFWAKKTDTKRIGQRERQIVTAYEWPKERMSRQRWRRSEKFWVKKTRGKNIFFPWIGTIFKTMHIRRVLLIWNTQRRLYHKPDHRQGSWNSSNRIWMPKGRSGFSQRMPRNICIYVNLRASDFPAATKLNSKLRLTLKQYAIFCLLQICRSCWLLAKQPFSYYFFFFFWSASDARMFAEFQVALALECIALLTVLQKNLHHFIWKWRKL